MITVFTIPKSFESQVAQAQLNAIQSWTRLLPTCEVVLCGDDPGVAEVAVQFCLTHISDIKVNEFGTPLLSDAFAQVEQAAQHSFLCYVNADIILLPDFVTAIQRITFESFLMIGRRWNIDDLGSLDFAQTSWDRELREYVMSIGCLQPPVGSDYFVFRQGSLGVLPPFAVGRPGWDNWMIFNARKRRIPVVDATQATVVVHQNHDYSHVQNRYDDKSYAGPEADHNLKIMGGSRTLFTMQDATHILDERNLTRACSMVHLQRRIVTLAALHPQLRPLADMVRGVWKRNR